MSELFPDQTQEHAAHAFEGEQLRQYAEAINRANEMVDIALGNLAEPRDLQATPFYKYDDILVASLDTPLAAQTLDTWTRMISVPKIPGATYEQNHERTRTMNGVFNNLEKPEVIEKMLAMYQTNEGTNMRDQLMGIFVAHGAYDGWTYPYRAKAFRKFMTEALPEQLAKTIAAINLEREGSVTDADDPALSDPEKAQLEQTALALASLMGSHPQPDIDSLMATLTSQWRQPGAKAAMDYVWDILLADYFASEHILKHWGLDGDELAEAWNYAYERDTLPDGSPMPDSPTRYDYVRENLAYIRELEYRDAGSAQGLRRLNGIRNFARYDIDVLHDMYQRRFTHHEHNVLYATSIHDHNGAFYKNRIFNKAQYDELVAAGIGVHFIEFDGEAELQKFTAAWLTHRPDEFFDLIVTSAHGSPYSMEARVATASEIAHNIGTYAIQGNVGRMARKVAHPRTVHVLNSCSTGKEKDGVGATLNFITGNYTLAPAEAAGIASLLIEHDQGKVTNVEVVYTQRTDAGDNTWGSRPVKTMIFDGSQPYPVHLDAF
jgi:hypothetical protein